MKNLARRLALPILRRIDARISNALDSRINAISADVEARLVAAQLHLETRMEDLKSQVCSINGLEQRIHNQQSNAYEQIKSEFLDHVQNLKGSIESVDRSIEQRANNALIKHLFLPSRPALANTYAEFLPYSTCSAADFLHPKYSEICAELSMQPVLHRKMWEWVFVVHKLRAAGVLREGFRGIGFGVGQERLPALFAKLGAETLATDGGNDLDQSAAWALTKQHSNDVSQLFCPEIVSNDVVVSKVRHLTCDMNEINANFTGFDFTWSCCALEHLGSLEHGIQFVINSVEKTLKIGGVACHTTEFNLSSDQNTVEAGETVLYRKRDIEDLISRLTQRGHTVDIFSVAPDSHYLDGFVDAPPYTHNPHIKLELAGYVTTSIGIVVRRGK